ncbi:MAG: type I-F CRISPR-associated protein Csy1 [Aliivibrio sp.]|uniref:type I-F CRISPR-associated protein Csy1 n=1 Tax=Aliivibrio sp. TaxID=1872443 RepID=UPI001A5F3EE5|nr:type I-F CRISPR-associated protein Csy1 [Aliivibrio sp.]
MVDEKKEFETWQEVIVDFLSQRENRKMVDLLSKKDSKKKDDDEKQAVLIQLEFALGHDDSVDKEQVRVMLSQKNTGKSKIDPMLFLKSKYEKLISLSDSESVKKVVEIYNTKLKEIINFHVPRNWLDYYSSRASGVSFSTHVAKITHSSIKASSFFVSYDEKNKKLLTTDTILNPMIDDAIDNAALTPIATFLKLVIKGNMLGNLLFSGDCEPLITFSENADQAEIWRSGFSEVFLPNDLSSHTLLKQIYFPICEKKEIYHLLTNVKSSSLAHELFLELTKKTERIKKYSNEELVYYPNKSKLSLTASSKAHTNVSPLHSKREGKIYLLSNQPPTWQIQLAPPIYKKSLFDESFFYQNMNEDINYLRDFLLRFKRIDLSIKDPDRQKWIERWMANIIDEFLFFAGNIQSLPAGWTAAEDIQLKSAHQYLLDPYRQDIEYQAERKGTDWQAVICDDFAHWVNRKLIGKDKQFTPQSEHSLMWRSLLAQPLRDHSEMLDAELKFQTEVNT